MNNCLCYDIQHIILEYCSIKQLMNIATINEQYMYLCKELFVFKTNIFLDKIEPEYQQNIINIKNEKIIFTIEEQFFKFKEETDTIHICDCTEIDVKIDNMLLIIKEIITQGNITKIKCVLKY